MAAPNVEEVTRVINATDFAIVVHTRIYPTMFARIALPDPSQELTEFANLNLVGGQFFEFSLFS